MNVEEVFLQLKISPADRYKHKSCAMRVLIVEIATPLIHPLCFVTTSWYFKLPKPESPCVFQSLNSIVHAFSGDWKAGLEEVHNKSSTGEFKRP